MNFEFDTPVDTAVTVAVVILCCIGLAAYFRSVAQQAKREREEHARFIERMRLECSTILADITAERAGRLPITDKYKTPTWTSDGQDVMSNAGVQDLSGSQRRPGLVTGDHEGYPTQPSQYARHEILRKEASARGVSS